MYVWDDEAGDWIDDGQDYSINDLYQPEQLSGPVDEVDWSGYANLTGPQLAEHAKEIESNLRNSSTFSGLLKQYGNKALDLLKTDGAYDPLKLAKLGMGAYAASRPNTVAPTGYQGKIPKYTAERTMLNAPPVGRRPGSGGIDYGGGVTYKNPAGEVVSSNERTLEELRQAAESNPFNRPATYERPVVAVAKGGLVSDGFVVPADVVSHLGNGSSDAGLKLLAARFNATPIKGEGDGMSDSIKTKIDGVQEARVANEEAFISPETVERIGNGNPEKGAKKLYAMMDKIRKDRTGTKSQGKQIEADKYMPGGSVGRYATGGTTVPAGTTGSESSLSNWAGDYVTDLLGRGSALAQAPYEAYTGPLTAGASNLQQQAFTQAAGLQTPSSIGDAATKAGEISAGLSNMPAYTAANTDYNKVVADKISSNFAAPQDYAAGKFANQYVAPTLSNATQFDNQYKAPSAYETGQFDGGIFGTEQARQYMNPYLQTSLEPQLAEARRQADISRLADAGRLTQAGAYGGSRQAIMEAEARRNLGTKLADITGAGYNTAYTNAMTQFNADQTRAQTAQKERELSRQFGATKEMTAAEMQAKYGMDALSAQELARQFNQKNVMTSAEMQAKYGLSAQEAEELSRQFAATNKYNIAKTAGEQYLDAQKANQSSGLTAAKYTNDAYLEAQRQNELSRQFGSELGIKSDEAAIRGLTAQGNLADTGYRAELAGINQLASLGATERGIESEGIAADKAQFEEARLNPYSKIQFEQSLLSGLPLASQSYTVPGTSDLQQFAQGTQTAQQLLDILSGKTPAAAPAAQK